MAYLVQKEKDDKITLKLVLTQNELKSEISRNFTSDDKIKCIIEVESNLVVREVVPSMSNGYMSIVTKEKYSLTSSEDVDIYVVFFETESFSEICIFEDNEKSLKETISINLQIGNKVETIYKISSKEKKYSTMKAEIEGFELVVK